MKLSKLLKNFPKKHKYGRTERCYLCDEYEPCSHNNLINACDQEIDRDALGNVLLNMIVDFLPDESVESADRVRGYEDRIVDSFISTMPAWLKRIEK